MSSLTRGCEQGVDQSLHGLEARSLLWCMDMQASLGRPRLSQRSAYKASRPREGETGTRGHDSDPQTRLDHTALSIETIDCDRYVQGGPDCVRTLLQDAVERSTRLERDQRETYDLREGQGGPCHEFVIRRENNHQGIVGKVPRVNCSRQFRTR